jgi:hypothetical protein
VTPCNTALAISAGESLVFSPQDGLTHIPNPRTGQVQTIGVTSLLNTHEPQSPMLSTALHLADAGAIARLPKVLAFNHNG